VCVRACVRACVHGVCVCVCVCVCVSRSKEVTREGKEIERNRTTMEQLSIQYRKIAE